MSTHNTCFLWRNKKKELAHDKTKKMATKWHVRPGSKDSDQPGHVPSLIRVFAVVLNG